jgi:transmembrane 9 superfamily protein 3
VFGIILTILEGKAIIRIYMLGAIVLLAALALARSDDNNHIYAANEVVSLWVNTVGPYHNPQETYSYYDLPFCKPQDLEIKKRPSGIGEILEGHELTNSGFLLHFASNAEHISTT